LEVPRRNLGKTATIKQRTIYVYLPSIEMVKDWKERAKRAGMSLSKFIIERVEDSIRREEGDEAYLSRLELIKRLREAEEEIRRLRKENKMLKMLVENLEKELRLHRARSFLEEDFVGVRRFSRELIDLLKERKALGPDEILELLNIDPAETELVKAINKQLEILEEYGLVEYSGRKWRWVG